MKSPSTQDLHEAAQLQSNGAYINSGKVVENPALTDVLFGRGVATNRHPGNEKFRAIVNQHVDVYLTSTKKQKTMISRSIVNKVHTELDPPGRFLEKNTKTGGVWQEVNIKRALEKTAQALRDGAAPMRKQLSEDMSDPAFMDAVFDGSDTAGKSSSLNTSTKKSKKHQRTKPVSLIVDLTSSDSHCVPVAKKQRLDPRYEAHNDQSLPQQNFLHPMTQAYEQTQSGHHRQVSFQPPLTPLQPPVQVQYDMSMPYQDMSSAMQYYPQTPITTDGVWVNHDCSNTMYQQPCSAPDCYAPIPLLSSGCHENALPNATSVSGFLKVLQPALSLTNEDFLRTALMDDESTGRIDLDGGDGIGGDLDILEEIIRDEYGAHEFLK